AVRNAEQQHAAQAEVSRAAGQLGCVLDGMLGYPRHGTDLGGIAGRLEKQRPDELGGVQPGLAHQPSQSRGASQSAHPNCWKTAHFSPCSSLDSKEVSDIRISSPAPADNNSRAARTPLEAGSRASTATRAVRNRDPSTAYTLAYSVRCSP